MLFLLRVQLPDAPGSLGRVATAIGEAGGDIDAIEIVEHRSDGTAVDDVLLEMAPGAMPDSVVSACTTIEGVTVLWISRYAAGGNLFLDLEAVEHLTGRPEEALDRLVEILPMTFRSDWAARVRLTADGSAEIVKASEAAPSEVDWPTLTTASRIEVDDDVSLHAGAPLGKDEVVIVGRRGGPEYLASELARIGHLATLAVSIQRG